MPMDIRLRDRVEMKKPHPCGEKIFEITRVGMDVKLRCTGCGHEVMLPRAKADANQRNRMTGFRITVSE